MHEHGTARSVNLLTPEPGRSSIDAYLKAQTVHFIEQTCWLLCCTFIDHQAESWWTDPWLTVAEIMHLSAQVKLQPSNHRSFNVCSLVSCNVCSTAEKMEIHTSVFYKMNWISTLCFSPSVTKCSDSQLSRVQYGTDSYLVIGGRAVWPGARQQNRGSRRGAAWWPPTCSLYSSAGQPPRGPGCWCPLDHDPAWSGLEEGRKVWVTSNIRAIHLIHFQDNKEDLPVCILRGKTEL